MTERNPLLSASDLMDLKRRLTEVEDQLHQVLRQLESLKRQSRHAAVNRICALMADYGITTRDLMPSPIDEALDAVARQRSGLAAMVSNSPVASVGPKLLFSAKYRHPVSGNAWSGNGEMPSWLKMELAEGRHVADFEVKG